METIEYNLSELIAKPFWKVHYDINHHLHTHYWLAGGRGSTKSSFASMEVVHGIINNPECHAVVLRKVASSLKTSVYEQIRWAIEHMHLSHAFDFRTSPPQITYKETGQKIMFLGVDNPVKIKSLKTSFGYVGYVFYEETDQFGGMEEIRNVNQSLLRGGHDYVVLYAYNPPASRDNWVNKEILIEEEDKYISHTDYRSIPKEWLGEKFFYEAEKLKNRNELMYRHEYLGEVTGTGGDVFTNVEEITLSDDDIRSFEYKYYGLDFGFTIDPLAFNACSYDKKHETLYIYDEIYQVQLANRKAYQMIIPKLHNQNTPISADSAEPKSISELKGYGLNIYPVKKGADSVDYGISWLQRLEKIYIDKRRCPNTYIEFIGYEYERNKYGEYISNYPDKNNHAIDAVRYACSNIMRRPMDIKSRKSGIF